MCCQGKRLFGLGVVVLAGVVGLTGCFQTVEPKADEKSTEKPATKQEAKIDDPKKVEKVHPKGKKEKAPDENNPLFQLPNEKWKLAFKDERPIVFVNRNQNPVEWDNLKEYWNVTTEATTDPMGRPVTRGVVKIKVPLGLNANPPVPAENPMTVASWALGKKLYFDPILSSDRTVSCATCHDPMKGYTDQSIVSTGIGGAKGGVSSPTVFNSGYHQLQFWDGRAASLEEQAQGPVGNSAEMFDARGEAWPKAVERLRSDAEYVKLFKQAFGTLPTRDATAKAIATYERTVLSGNSIQDRAELAMRKRVEAEETGKLVLLAKDYASVLKEAFAKKDIVALKALNLDADKDQAQIDTVAKSLVNGRNVFFGKARCNSCHVGENYTDNSFHNLGVGVKEGVLPKGTEGRFGSQPIGHKNPAFYGAFKTPTLRALLDTAPYLHDGSEKTLEQVVDFYDRGGNANAYLDNKMRDEESERNWLIAQAEGKPYKGPEPKIYDGKPIIPLKLNLTPQEKKDLVLFMRGLNGDALDPVVADKDRFPK